jgi:hypothetical protein
MINRAGRKRNTNLISKPTFFQRKNPFPAERASVHITREKAQWAPTSLSPPPDHTNESVTSTTICFTASRNERRRQARPRPTVRSHTHTHTHTRTRTPQTRIHGTGSNGRCRGKQRRRRAWERRGAGERGPRAGSGSDVAAGAEGRAGGGGARAAALLHRAPRAQARRGRLTVLVVSRNPVLLSSPRSIRT